MYNARGPKHRRDKTARMAMSLSQKLRETTSERRCVMSLNGHRLPLEKKSARARVSGSMLKPATKLSQKSITEALKGQRS